MSGGRASSCPSPTRRSPDGREGSSRPFAFCYSPYDRLQRRKVKAMSKVAWIGLGVMGYPMAGHLKMRGHHDVVVFNRTKAKADAWAHAFGGTAAPTPAAAVRDADFIFTCVGDDNDLREVTLGSDGAFSALKCGAVAVDNTTASA